MYICMSGGPVPRSHRVFYSLGLQHRLTGSSARFIGLFCFALHSTIRLDSYLPTTRYPLCTFPIKPSFWHRSTVVATIYLMLPCNSTIIKSVDRNSISNRKTNYTFTVHECKLICNIIIKGVLPFDSRLISYNISSLLFLLHHFISLRTIID